MFKVDIQPDKEKYYLLEMFPYPSGKIHMGHVRNYTIGDVVARYKRMRGFNVLHPMGFDSFGLPAEQYAVQTGTHPAITTENNINTYRRQLRRLGLSHDQRRAVSTTDPSYYRWTQWIFSQIFNAWYDPDADRARPVAELVAELDGVGILGLPADEAGPRGEQRLVDDLDTTDGDVVVFPDFVGGEEPGVDELAEDLGGGEGSIDLRARTWAIRGKVG